ncbi:helix-turn-helix transcriptional regulator [Streptomyces sp. NPDC087422]|uniref:helix-turn-helix transcriptional regulator n=1 Tax=Streptomyces sp. NPDC087422 TaxID=3365786 RepID=UPI003822A9BB
MPVTQTQKPPPGFVFIEDYEDEDGNVTPGVASRLGISVSTYKKWRLAKKGPKTFRHGKRVMARESVVDAWLAGLGESDGDTADEAAAHDARPPEPRVGRQRRARHDDADANAA